MSVTWLSSAQGLIPTSSRDRLSAELEELFPGAQIIVHTHFRGYSKSPGRAVVLGVEVKRGDDYRTYVAKIGPRAEALSDAKGWQTCTKGLDFASHIMLPVEARPLKDRRRAAVIYPNALTFFGPTQEGRGRQGPHQLDEVVEWAVFDDLPSYESVERVVRQIYTQLDWWFYRSSQPRAAAARAFYRRKLRRAHHRWKTDEERVRLRRDAIWLLGGLDKPDTDKPARYLDPYDLVEWALAEKRVPQTLVGRSHGDLHGKNILVGVQRGEAE